MGRYKHGRYQTVEVIIAQNFSGNQVNFPDVPEIRSDGDRDCLVHCIAISDSLANPLTPAGNANATLAAIQNANLTIYCLGSLKLVKVPLIRFLNYRNNGSTYFSSLESFETEPLRVDWTQSYVSFNSPPSTSSAFSFLFEFGYDWYAEGTYQQYLINLNKKQAAGII